MSRHRVVPTVGLHGNRRHTRLARVSAIPQQIDVRLLGKLCIIQLEFPCAIEGALRRSQGGKEEQN